ncbi:arylalkylamine N-acetyltransferase 1-like [Topomyia yanbarensis]|uniref:arylalkylamine N-acetyltransferase 1-like n=1 Tax=Topomyia yanbarensis TaxID=2498891 RepID=UPI00273CA43D|nr:arylalkylamine N-acetyltransferase 1-like [Topomyia yanbarensis]XP_058837089.1 arylalkylamine N-acetyltransferase 1-like [Topomyia yanbarensis]XP_058837090.1 arylalkylamine N-acetyltransferase 1-like [Topomyia yanbarensis]
MLSSKEPNLRLEVITSKYYDDVINHLRRTFFADEPLNKAVNLTRPGQGHRLLELHSLTTLKDNISIMAISHDGEIAGVALNGILHGNSDIEKSLDKLNDINDENFKKIFKLLYEQNYRINLFKQFDVDKIFEIRILSVDSKFRGQGLAKILLKKSEELALERGFQVMKTDATGAFSQRVVSSLGFITKGEIKYTDYLDSNGDQIFVVEPPHEKLKIMCKVIN